MSKIKGAIYKLHTIREEALEDRWINRVYPLFKLLLTCLYIGMLTSVSREDLDILLSLGIYLLILFVAGDISLKECIARLWIALPFVCIMGIMNIFLEQEVQFYLGKLPITTGMLDFVSLLIKGVESLLAVYLLVVTTTIEKICASLRKIHCPGILVTLLLLIYRYIELLLGETEKMLQAYHLRAPGQKG
ncbi:MAG: energy-coupling factor transporter transmembrane protein EcfT, partial [Lachnospiraceae bacterium]|nr:energy-coupling factor transporter transmembrane protein EcfT [Lachnospiraceae bacterium]